MSLIKTESGKMPNMYVILVSKISVKNGKSEMTI